MELTGRQQRRAKALALQIHSAGHFVPCNCGLRGCYYRATPRDRAAKIVQGQWKTLRLTDEVVREALRQVQLI